MIYGIMTFFEFTLLPQEEQYNLVFTEGEFIDHSMKNEIKFALYRLYSFYVEVVYNVKNNKIVNLSSFMNARN